ATSFRYFTCRLLVMLTLISVIFFYNCFFFTAPSPTEISTLSLHDALPILCTTAAAGPDVRSGPAGPQGWPWFLRLQRPCVGKNRSEEHTSELQSRGHLVCRLLLEKKKNNDSDNPISRLRPRRHCIHTRYNN